MTTIIFSENIPTESGRLADNKTLIFHSSKGIEIWYYFLNIKNVENQSQSTWKCIVEYNTVILIVLKNVS